MDPVTAVLVPGIIGGLAFALLAFGVNRRRPSAGMPLPHEPDGPITAMSNMSSIKVAGVGGLGLVAMALWVALNVPRIGTSIGIGLALGALLAVVLVLRARRDGPLPSSGKGTGASTVLELQGRPASEAPRPRHDPGDVALSPART